INKKLEALFNVNFDKNVASDITLKVFSFIDSQDYTIPQLENNPLLTDTIKIDDSDDINNNGDSKESLISSGNNYVINKNSIIDIKQVVKGNLDQKYTSLAYTNPNNLVNVELQLSNKTDKNISKLVLIDSLPNKNNHSLVSNKLLNSNYNLMLNGPIKVDKEWLNKVNIKYSTAINPSKVNILDKYTNYQVNSTKLSDINCDKTVWLNEDEVKDWSKIHSFKLEINNDIDFISGASHKISFNLKVLDTVNYQKTLFDDKLPLKQRVAYNTFALSANYSQVIEPQTSAIVLSNSTNNKINKENNNDLEEDGVKCINCKIVDSGNNNLFFGLSIITMMLILSGGYSLKKK
ncbi:MAG: hypothetical protein LBR40_02335, partial [Bacilli bacterium]|nr:hypothetical protein [Bacilli bacterium]